MKYRNHVDPDQVVSEEASRSGSSLLTKEFISVFTHCFSKLVVVWCVSVVTTVLHTFLSAPACTSIVYSKELERDVTATAMAKALLRLKTLAPFLHRTWSVRFFYVWRKNNGCYVHAMCKMRLFWAKTGKTSAYFLRFDIKLKKSRSVFDLVTVLISKHSFFQHHVWPVYQGKSYLHGKALPDFYIVSSFFYKKSKQARVPTFVWLFRDVATSAKGPGCDEGTNIRWMISR